MKIGNFFKDETGKDSLFVFTLDDLKNEKHLFALYLIKQTQTIYGKNVASLLELPSKKALIEDLQEIVRQIKLACGNLLINFEFMIEVKVKRTSYYTISRIPAVMAAFYFLQTSEYPASRAQLRNMGDLDLTRICDILDKYNVASKQEVENAILSSLSLITRIGNELKQIS